MKTFSEYILEGNGEKCGCCGKKTEKKKCECGCHKMPDGSLHSGKTHTKTSVPLFHMKDLSKTAKEKAMKMYGKPAAKPKKKAKSKPKKKPMKRGY